MLFLLFANVKRAQKPKAIFLAEETKQVLKPTKWFWAFCQKAEKLGAMKLIPPSPSENPADFLHPLP